MRKWRKWFTILMVVMMFFFIVSGFLIATNAHNIVSAIGGVLLSLSGLMSSHLLAKYSYFEFWRD